MTIIKAIENAFTKSGIKKNTKESISWFRNRATKLGVKSANSKKIIDSYKTVSSLKPGELYMFHYDAKFKDELEVWDSSPLIFVLEVYNDSFLGLNLHYLPPKMRQVVLLQYAGANMQKRKAKVLSYQISLALLKTDMVDKMIKKYLYTHLRSKIARVPFKDWPIVIFLPLASFHKKSKGEVWSS